MPLTIALGHDFLSLFKGTNRNKEIKKFLQKRGIKFDKNTESYIDYKTLQTFWIQKDVFALDETDHARYETYFQMFLDKYFSEKYNPLYVDFSTLSFDDLNFGRSSQRQFFADYLADVTRYTNKIKLS